MDFATVFFIANGLAMDAFAVAVANGILLKKTRLVHALRFGLFFGVFQFMMPIFGWLLGIAFAERIQAYDHWVAFVLLAFIGGKMFLEGCEDEEVHTVDEAQILSVRNMTLLAIATSIDALAVGVSFAMIQTNVYTASLIIGIVAFTLSAIGVMLGKKLGGMVQKGAEKFGGIVLILIGSKILVEHLFFMG